MLLMNSFHCHLTDKVKQGKVQPLKLLTQMAVHCCSNHEMSDITSLVKQDVQDMVYQHE